MTTTRRLCGCTVMSREVDVLDRNVLPLVGPDTSVRRTIRRVHSTRQYRDQRSQAVMGSRTRESLSERCTTVLAGR